MPISFFTVYVKRKATTKASISNIDFEAQKEWFLFDIRTIIEMEDIPNELVINWDHTGIHYVPVSNWTMAAEGLKWIEVAGLGDKRQLTAVFGASLAGDFLLPQIIYAGKTPRCLPSTKFPEDWDIIFTVNHWANEKTTEAHIKVLVPYIGRSCLSHLIMQPLSYLTSLKASAHPTFCLCLIIIKFILLSCHPIVQTTSSH